MNLVTIQQEHLIDLNQKLEHRRRKITIHSWFHNYFLNEHYFHDKPIEFSSVFLSVTLYYFTTTEQIGNVMSEEKWNTRMLSANQIAICTYARSLNAMHLQYLI